MNDLARRFLTIDVPYLVLILILLGLLLWSVGQGEREVARCDRYYQDALRSMVPWYDEAQTWFINLSINVSGGADGYNPSNTD